MIPWQTFKGRRKIDLAALIQDAGVESYEALVEHLAGQDVSPPSQEEYSSAASEAQSKTASTNKTARGSKRSTRKTAQKTPTANDNPDEVWQDGLEGSYQAKKTANRKRRPARKATPKKKS